MKIIQDDVKNLHGVNSKAAHGSFFFSEKVQRYLTVVTLGVEAESFGLGQGRLAFHVLPFCKLQHFLDVCVCYLFLFFF